METGTVMPSDMQIHAVKYWPEPVGYQGVFVNNDRDPYTNIYEEIHATRCCDISDARAYAGLLVPGGTHWCTIMKFSVGWCVFGFVL